jgi:hypothetical protein
MRVGCDAFATRYFAREERGGEQFAAANLGGTAESRLAFRP